MDPTGKEKQKGKAVVEEEEGEELSVGLQQLLQRLEGKDCSEPGASLGKIAVKVDGKHTRISCWLFDAADSSYSYLEECWMMLPLGAEAKLRLLQAIGSCRTLREIDVEHLTGNELEVLLEPMQSNPVLESLVISSPRAAGPTYAADQYVDRTCAILGRILGTSRTLTSLSLMLYLWGLTAKGAYLLASGLRDNAESALEELYLHQGRKSSVVKHVADIVLSAPRLRELGLLEVGVLDTDGVNALANALSLSMSLKSLWLRNVVKGASALLLQALTGERSNRTISTLKLDGVLERIGDSLPLLLSSNHLLKELFWEPFQEDLSPNEWQSVGQWFSSSSSFVNFRVGLPWSSFRGQAIDGVEALLSAVDMKKAFVGIYVNSFLSYGRFAEDSTWFCSSEWMDEDAEELLRKGDVKKPMCELHFGLNTTTDLTSMWADLAEALSSKVTLVSSLHMQMSPQLLPVEGKQVENFLEALRDSCSLRLLTIDGGNGEFWPGGWKRLVDSLRFNTSITHLRLIDCNDLEDVFRQLTGVLRVNPTLKRIRLKGTSWEDGKKAAIEEDLRRNAARESYFSVFRRKGLPFHSARNGRLFLCGSSTAGKTRLRQTMTQIPGTKRLGQKATRLSITKGIEVELLKDDQEMQIAIWDLAGSRMFRTLQERLLSQTSDTSIFLFVFSPYDSENRCMKNDLDHRFKTELEEWLSFIISTKSHITGQMLPKVLVVISHMDKSMYRDVSWAKGIVQELREEFHDILDICNSDNLYQVDTRRFMEVNPIRDFIIGTFRDLLKDNTHIVPEVCLQMSSLLRTKDMKLRPVLSSTEFYSFCFSSLRDNSVVKSLNPETPSGLKFFMAMTSYLHDRGNIIAFSSLDRIIVDPNWLTNVLLGELITMVHTSRFIGREGNSPELVFVSSSDLQSLLDSFVGKHPEFGELDNSFLEELLIHFGICFKLDDVPVNARYYIPTILCEDVNFTTLSKGLNCSGMYSLQWGSPVESSQEFIGFRVQSNDRRRMSMTAALYPRFQIHLRQKLMTAMNLTDGAMVLSLHYMHIHVNGHEVFVERNSDSAKSHIDVMVKCSQHNSREIAVKFIKNNIIYELFSFCASSQGCPNIALVVGILSTRCVKQLVPLEYRGDNHVILMTQLKENFEEYIMKRLEEEKPESCDEYYSSILNYEVFSWPSILAKELLSEREMESLTEKILEKHEQQLNGLHQRLDQIAEEMNQEITEVRDLASSSTSISEMDGYDQTELERLRSRIYAIGQFERYSRREMDTRRIISFRHQLESSVSTFMLKLDKVIGYSELERSTTPKRPYLICEDPDMLRVRLHFMCESISGPHMIEGQLGLDLWLQKENIEWVRCMYHISSRVLYYLGKASLHLTSGFGQTVQFGAHYVELFNTNDKMVSLNRSGNMNLDEAWSHLRSYLSLHSRDTLNYLVNLRLFKVKYWNLEEGGFSLVCDECRNRGMQNGSLEVM